MADLEEHVSIELVDAGGHKDRVVMVLSKVKGLTMPPEQLVQHIPCTVATDVPRSLAEKLKEYLEKAGAMVMLEGEQVEEEEELFSADEFPITGENEAEDALFASTGDDVLFADSGTDDMLEFEADPASDMGNAPDFEADDDLTFTADEIAEPPELPDSSDILPDADAPPEAAPKANIFQGLLAKLPALGKKKTVDEPVDDDAAVAEEPESEDTVAKKSPLAFLEKLRKPKSAPEEPEDELVSEVAEIAESGKKQRPDFLSSPIAYVLIGLLAGALVAGIWGNFGIQKQRQKLVDYELQTAQEIEKHSAELKDMVADLTEKVAALQQQNADLQAQNAGLGTELEEAQQQPSGIVPTDSPLEMMPWEEALIGEFQPIMERHAQILEDAQTGQQQAGCSQQVLLDGNGTLTYAQVVKQFSARYTRYDIRRSDSLLTPYIAELKIPFQQEMRAGATAEACDAATLQSFELPTHHEFGGYYGYWTLEYAYKDGEWVLNTSVIERNRDLYPSAFQKGSPDYAKFKIDTVAFPGLGEK